MKELEVIDRLRKAFPGCGIGDDAAVLPPAEGELLFAADAMVEGVHFERKFSTLSQAVQKLVTSNISDIFAMGGSPGSIVFTAGLPPGCTSRDVDGIIDGLSRSSAHYGVKLVGGDTVASPGGFVFNVAIVGEVRPGRAVLRSGARVGDAVVLFGRVGRSLAGLRVLASLYGGVGGADEPAPRVAGLPDATKSLKKVLPRLSLSTSAGELEKIARSLGSLSCAREIVECAQCHLTPLAFPLEAELLDAEPPRVTAMIDVSDGLAKDLRTLCVESGVGALVREEALPVAGAVRELFGVEGRALVDFALSSGEEYVLLATIAREAAEKLPAGAVVVGEVVRSTEGVALLDGKGKGRPLPKLGYEHVF